MLIVDEAHSLSHEMLEEIRLLSNLETLSHKPVNIILVGQPELDEKLSSPELRPLTQRIALRYHLPSMTLEETSKYIETRLLRSGAKDLGIFTGSAVQSIYEHTQGIPRLINILADHALLTGYVKDLKRIDDKVIKECATESGLPAREDRKEAGSLTIPPHSRYGSLVKPVMIIAIMIIVILAGVLVLWRGVLDDGIITSDIDKDSPVAVHELITNGDVISNDHIEATEKN